MIPGIMSSYKLQAAQGKDKAGAGHSLLTSMMSKSSLDRGACMPILSSYFPISQAPRKHSWPLLTAVPQYIPYCTVSKYSACPCFKTFKLAYIIFVANAYSLMPAALSPPDCSQQHPVHLPSLPLKKALFSLHKPTQCLRCQLHLRVTLLHG